MLLFEERYWTQYNNNVITAHEPLRLTRSNPSKAGDVQRSACPSEALPVRVHVDAEIFHVPCLSPTARLMPAGSRSQVVANR